MRKRPGVRRRVIAAGAGLALVAACSPTPTTGAAGPSASSAGTSTTRGPLPASLGDFPPLPQARLAQATAAELQTVLDESVDAGIIEGASAAVAIAGSGHWSGASGVNRDGEKVEPDSLLETASAAKTVTAAVVMRLVEQGRIGLDDEAAMHLPAGYDPLQSSGIRIRDLLGMRSGLSDPLNYDAVLARGGNGADVLKAAQSTGSASADIHYANLNFLLLGEVIEHTTEEPFSRSARAILDSHGLDRMVLPEFGAVSADGSLVQADAASMTRWAYQLYGGHVLSPASLAEMTSFRGEWYGLGTIDFSHPNAAINTATPAVGHGGQGASGYTTIMAVFPQTDTVVAVQAFGGEIESLGPLSTSLSDAAQP